MAESNIGYRSSAEQDSMFLPNNFCEPSTAQIRLATEHRLEIACQMAAPCNGASDTQYPHPMGDSAGLSLAQTCRRFRTQYANLVPDRTTQSSLVDHATHHCYSGNRCCNHAATALSSSMLSE